MVDQELKYGLERTHDHVYETKGGERLYKGHQYTYIQFTEYYKLGRGGNEWRK